jgi:hypothetical protein
VLLGRNRARPICTVRARPGHGLRPRPAQLARPACAALAAQLGRPAQRASARRHCPAACGSAAALLSVSVVARHRCTGDGGETVAHRRGDGGVARRRRASDARRRRIGRWRLRTATVGTAARVRRAVGRRAVRARRRSGASGARRLSGTARAR